MNQRTSILPLVLFTILGACAGIGGNSKFGFTPPKPRSTSSSDCTQVNSELSQAEASYQNVVLPSVNRCIAAEIAAAPCPLDEEGKELPECVVQRNSKASEACNKTNEATGMTDLQAYYSIAVEPLKRLALTCNNGSLPSAVPSPTGNNAADPEEGNRDTKQEQ